MIEHDGGPAFPVAVGEDEMWVGPGSPNGMTLRDYFAGQALAGLCAAHNSEGTWTGAEPGDNRFVAKVAYSVVDAMIRARTAAPAAQQEGE